MEPLNPYTSPPSLQADERAALRAYLQRTEVRLSTLHRVAGLFVSGAGLLVLMATFFDTAILSLLEIAAIYFIQAAESLNTFSTVSWGLDIIIIIAIISVPMYAVYKLVKDLIIFYFDSNIPGYHLTAPRFSIPTLALAPDELSDGKAAVLRAQYQGVYATQGLREDHGFKDMLLKSSVSGLVDRVADSGGEPGADSSAQAAISRERLLRESGVSGSAQDTHRINSAFDVAGLVDLDLRDDAARTEILMTKKIILLRSIVLRYFKALIVTLVATFGLLIGEHVVRIAKMNPDLNMSVLSDEKLSLLLINLAFLVIFGLLHFSVQAPVRWIYEQSGPRLKAPDLRIDSKISRFEKYTRTISVAFGGLTCLILGGLFFM